VATLLAGTPSGTGGIAGTTSPTLTTAIAKGAGTTTGTAFTIHNSAGTVKAIIRDDGNYGLNGYVPSTHLPTSGYAGVWMDTSNSGIVGEVTSGFKAVNICANATRSAASQWAQQDTARNSFILSVGYEASNNGMSLFRAAAGSGNTLVSIFSVDTSGNQTALGRITGTAGIVYGTFTVATFPTTTYLEAVVTDALAPVIGATVAAGGSAKCKVMYNGSAKIVTAVL
jgi:hypothetical protein